MSRLETIRTHLSHFVLRNGILARLGITSDILAASPAICLEQVAKRVLEIDAISANHRAALNTWYGGPEFGLGARQATTELMAVIAELRSFRPTSRFPSGNVVDGWLNQMERFFHQLEKFPELSGSDRNHLAHGFAEGAMNLLDFLSYLDADSSEFRTYFQRANSNAVKTDASVT